MKGLFYIEALLLLYVILTAKSCDDRPGSDESVMQSDIEKTVDSLSAWNASDTLSDPALQSFENRAKSGLADFCDYLKVCSDTSLPAAFRTKASEMAGRIFVADNAAFKIVVPGENKDSEVLIKELITQTESGNKNVFRIIPDSIRVIQSLRATGEGVYQGKLGFTCIMMKTGTHHTNNLVQLSGSVDFFVTRHQKRFGADTLLVWETLLGKGN